MQKDAERKKARKYAVFSLRQFTVFSGIPAILIKS